MKKYAKENYNNNLEDIISDKENGNKSFWQIMGRFMGNNNNLNTIPPLKISDNTYAFTDNEKATFLNGYFCSISSVDDKNTALPNFANRANSTLPNTINSETDVKDILSLLKVNKASGPDGISHRMLKTTCNTIAIPLCKLFNLSIQQQIYPSLWKSANIMPIF